MPAVSTTLDLNLELLDGAAVSAAIAFNLEQLNGAPHSLLVNPNVELQNGTDATTTKSVNLQIIDALEAAGSPDSILNLPPFATSSRLRADFFKWESDNPSSLFPDSEYIGAKVGSAPLLSMADFQYTARLSAVGDWSITVPVADDKLQCIYDGTAQIIKIYYENVGCIFTGWISGYNISNSDSLEIYGFDMMILLQRAKSLWRIVIWKLWVGFDNSIQNAPWYYVFMRLIETWCNIIQVQFEQLSAFPTFDRTNYRTFFPTYQDQSVLEIARDLGEISGNSFRMEPATGIITFGLFGDDSGIILSEFQQDDVEVREQGGLQITGISLTKNEEDLVNFLIPQGSNDSFGVAVELRHTSGDDGTVDTRRYVHQNRYVDTVKIPPGNPRLWDDNPIVQKRSGGEYLLVVGEHFRYGYTGHFTTQYGEINFEFRYNMQASRFRESEEVLFSFTPVNDFYLTFISVLNLGGIGDPQFYFRGGAYPDWIRFPQTNWDVNRPGWASLPGYEPEWPYNIFTGQQGQVNQDHQLQYPDFDLQRAPVTEALAFMNLPRLPDDPTPPWPLCEAGVTYNIKVDSSLKIFGNTNGEPELLIYASPDQERGDQVNPNNALVVGSPAVRVLPRWAIDLDNDLYMEISGYPVGSVYPYAIEGMYAENAGGSDSDSGHRIFFLRDFESIRRYGLRPATVTFQTALDTLEGTNAIRPMSDLLNDMAQVYLLRHKDPIEDLTITTIGAFRIPKLGQKLRVVYKGKIEVENGAFNWVDINDLYYVTEVTWSVTNNGIQHTFKLSNVPENLTADLLTQDIIKSTRRSNNSLGEFQTSLNRIGRNRVRLVSRSY